MILVTVGGVEEFKFERLLKFIDELCDEKVLNGEDIVAQIGFNDYHARNYRTFDFIGPDEFKELEDKAEYIISHAGTGTVVSSVKKRKKVIVFPRLAEYNEHLDDHQLELCDLFQEKNYALIAKNKVELKECINRIPNFEPSEFVSNNGRINQMICDFIDEL